MPAPELIRKQMPTKTSDVYGMGTLFYEMLAGRPDYPARSRSWELVCSEVLEGRASDIKRSDLPVPPQGKGYRETSVSSRTH